MIKATFRYGGEIVEVIVRWNDVLFYNTHSQMTTPISGLKLSKAGVLKEFPELENNPDWKKIAIDNFNKLIRSMKTEMEKIEYIKDELKKYGYVPMFSQREGHRPIKFK